MVIKQNFYLIQLVFIRIEILNGVYNILNQYHLLIVLAKVYAKLSLSQHHLYYFIYLLYLIFYFPNNPNFTGLNICYVILYE